MDRLLCGRAGIWLGLLMSVGGSVLASPPHGGHGHSHSHSGGSRIGIGFGSGGISIYGGSGPIRGGYGPGIGYGGGYAPGYGYNQPVYVAPRPVYVAPQPVYVQPQPVYVQPQPVYSQPEMIYSQPTTSSIIRPSATLVVPSAVTPHESYDGGEIVVHMPADQPNLVHLQLNDIQFKIEPGGKQVFRNDRKWIAQFDRGNGNVGRYTLSSGWYSLEVTPNGWELFRLKNPPTGSAVANPAMGQNGSPSTGMQPTQGVLPPAPIPGSVGQPAPPDEYVLPGRNPSATPVLESPPLPVVP